MTNMFITTRIEKKVKNLVDHYKLEGKQKTLSYKKITDTVVKLTLKTEDEEYFVTYLTHNLNK